MHASILILLQVMAFMPHRALASQTTKCFTYDSSQTMDTAYSNLATMYRNLVNACQESNCSNHDSSAEPFNKWMEKFAVITALGYNITGQGAELEPPPSPTKTKLRRQSQTPTNEYAAFQSLLMTYNMLQIQQEDANLEFQKEQAFFDSLQSASAGDSG